MSMFDRKITQGTPDEGTTFFGIVKSGAKADRISVIDDLAVGKTVGCFTEYADGQVDKIGEIKVDIDLPEEVDLEKVKLYAIAQGEIKAPRDLKGFKSNEVQVQAFYEGNAIGKPFPAKMLELCFPEATPQPAPTSSPAPAPPAPSSPAPASNDDVELLGDIVPFYHPGETDEEIVNTTGKVKFWVRALELGLVKEDDFAYRKIVEVIGGVKTASTDPTGVVFRTQDLKQILK